jgi:DNA-binding winged helix-turn-helix (wHTH) protein/predicted ATPase
MIRFGRYALDPVQGLTRAGREVRLTPKSLDVLWILAERAGRVVTKDELFESAWADSAVTDSALATCIQEIRRALNDDARTPRFIETVHRRGYRFIARTAVPETDDRLTPAGGAGLEVPLVGRGAEVRAVLGAFESARHGQRQICFISGEPGVGKTAVLNECLARVSASGAVLVASAQCVERYGRGEPFQPLLDALMRLCRQPGGGRIVSALDRYAPMWLVQMPGLVESGRLAALQRTVAGASRDRMLRELTNAVETITTVDPLVLAIEDLHWSDPSTLDWIAMVAARPEPANVLIIATLRPPTTGELDAQLSALRDTMRARQTAREIELRGLHEADVSRFIAARLPPAPGHESAMTRLGHRLQQHTGGNPLFMATVLDQLVERQIVVPVGERWAASEEAEVADLGIPDTIRPVIERQLNRLSGDERAIMETASVVGDRFPVALVAQAVGVDALAAESTLTGKTSQRFVREAGIVELPDHTVSTELAFVHSLFREALYGSLPSARRVDLHRRVGELLERGWGPRAVDIAAELAVHFEQARDRSRAMLYLQHAAANARRRSAFKEARLHYERALDLLNRVPESAERTERELDLQMGLGATIMATSGFGARDVQAAYSRARSLSQQVSDTAHLFPALWGLWLFYWGRGDVRTGDDLAGQLQALAEPSDNPGLKLQALHASWATAFSQGRFGAAHRDAAEGIDLYDIELHAPMAASYGSHDPLVCALMFASRALAFIGRVDEAIDRSDRAMAHARLLGHPFSMALALTFRAALAQTCGDAAGAGRYATEGITIARDQGFGLVRAWCLTIGGWASVHAGDRAEGLQVMAEGIAAARSSGSDQFQPYQLGMLADACLHAGQITDGTDAVAEALAIVERTGEHLYEAELHRLNGDLILAAGGDVDDAVGAFRTAVDVARSQGAATLMLRAAIRLGRVPAHQQAPDSARDLIRAARMGIESTAAMPDIVEADALLVQ